MVRPGADFPAVAFSPWTGSRRSKQEYSGLELCWECFDYVKRLTMERGMPSTLAKAQLTPRLGQANLAFVSLSACLLKIGVFSLRWRPEEAIKEKYTWQWS